MEAPLWNKGASKTWYFVTAQPTPTSSSFLDFEAPLFHKGASYMLKCLWLCGYVCVCVCGSDFFEVTLNAKFSLISHPIWMKLWIMNLISMLKKSYDTTPNLVPSF